MSEIAASDGRPEMPSPIQDGGSGAVGLTADLRGLLNKVLLSA